MLLIIWGHHGLVIDSINLVLLLLGVLSCCGLLERFKDGCGMVSLIVSHRGQSTLAIANYFIVLSQDGCGVILDAGSRLSCLQHDRFGGQGTWCCLPIAIIFQRTWHEYGCAHYVTYDSWCIYRLARRLRQPWLWATTAFFTVFRLLPRCSVIMVASCIAHLEVLDKVCTLAFRVRVQDLDITMALVLINGRRCRLLAEASLDWCEI